MQTRRVFLREAGWTATGVLVLGAAACTGGQSTQIPSTSPVTARTGSPTTGAPADVVPPPGPTTTTTTQDLTWERVDMGFVSAYLLSRSGEVAVVDTGVTGNDGAIADGLAAIGAGWSDVSHVILTHSHGDHVGSLGAVLELAADATAHAGPADIPVIAGPREIRPVADGDRVFGMQIIATPGHTPGHISVLDPAGSLLVAGDALNGSGDGGVAGPNPQFTADMDQAIASVHTLAGLEYQAVVFGHGDPVISNAHQAVRALADTL